MTDASKFKESQLPKQEEAIFQAIAVAEGTPNPVIEVPFFLYPEVEKKLKEMKWRVLGTYRCTHNGRINMYTHLCPIWVNGRVEESEAVTTREDGESYFSRAGDL